MTDIKNIVLLHGWGLNSAIWNDYSNTIQSARPELSIYQIDLPGYGYNAGAPSSSDLTELAKACLADTPEQALWVGWSLGGMVAMQAALLEEGAGIQGLQLICSTPKFTRSDDWPSGVEVATFGKFCDELAADYQRTLTMFLLLQAGANRGARELARAAHSAICELPDPNADTLRDGIKCLADSDLRDRLNDIKVPVQVLSGRLDRVTNPDSSRQLAALLRAEYIELHCGHSPFLTNPEESLLSLLSFIEEIDAGQ